jgi:hypothetical protein
LKAINPNFFGALLAVALLAGSPASATSQVSAELESMYKADQSARSPGPGKQIDWPLLMVEDEKRLARVRQLLFKGALSSGHDFEHAAMIYQHGGTALDSLMAHDLAVIAVIKGNGHARWLAAASLDRYLRGIGDPQRFGTQSKFLPNGEQQFESINSKVPDSLRRVFGVPALASAMIRPAPPYPAQAPQDPAAAQEIEQMISNAEADMSAATSGKLDLDWAAMSGRASVRRERLRTLLEQDQLRTGREYYHAAMMTMQSGEEPDDFLTAHDLAVAAIGKGEPRAAQVAAESLDRFLKRTGRLQRYATQFEIVKHNPPRIYPFDPAIPDFIRAQYGVPTLAAARKYEAKLLAANKKRKDVFPAN